MQRISVISSNIVSIGYDGENQILEIEFQNGLYEYHNVPENIYEGFINATSHGRYFISHIKDKFYTHKKQ